MEFPPQCLRHRAAEGSLPHTWRPMEAKDGPLHVAAHLLHCQKLKDAALHLVQAVMVLLQNLVGQAEVQVVVVRAFGPGQRSQSLEVSTANCILWVLRLDVLQPLQLPLSDLLRLCAELRLLQRLAQRCYVILLVFRLFRIFACTGTIALGAAAIPFRACLELPHFFLKIIQLPTQHCLTELVLSAFLHLRTDLPRQLLDLDDLLGQVLHELEPLPHIDDLQNLLALRNGELRQARGNHVSEDRCRGRPSHFLVPEEVLEEAASTATRPLGGRFLQQLCHQLLHILYQRLDLGRSLGPPRFLEELDCRDMERGGLRESLYLEPGLSLDRKRDDTHFLVPDLCRALRVRGDAAVRTHFVQLLGVLRLRLHGDNSDVRAVMLLAELAQLGKDLWLDCHICPNGREYNLLAKVENEHVVPNCH
mmetsp:Transcript_81112/g.173489  ORF Transcript_81112/g.173489 Transcript_81112/m.173489 type:complete len:420 (-) Transcript_81112:63-1322(-)